MKGMEIFLYCIKKKKGKMKRKQRNGMENGKFVKK